MPPKNPDTRPNSATTGPRGWQRDVQPVSCPTAVKSSSPRGRALESLGRVACRPDHPPARPLRSTGRTAQDRTIHVGTQPPARDGRRRCVRQRHECHGCCGAESDREQWCHQAADPEADDSGCGVGDDRDDEHRDEKHSPILSPPGNKPLRLKRGCHPLQSHSRSGPQSGSPHRRSPESTRVCL